MDQSKPQSKKNARNFHLFAWLKNFGFFTLQKFCNEKENWLALKIDWKIIGNGQKKVFSRNLVIYHVWQKINLGLSAIVEQASYFYLIM